LKTVAVLYWTKTYFRQSLDFILKVDDDVFLNVYNFAKVIQLISPEIKAIYGFGFEDYQPTRNNPGRIFHFYIKVILLFNLPF